MVMPPLPGQLPIDPMTGQPIDPTMIPPDQLPPELMAAMAGAAPMDPGLAPNMAPPPQMDPAMMAPPPPPPPPPPPVDVPLYVPPLDVELMRGGGGPTRPISREPIYPAGYVKPPKPDPLKIKEQATILFHRHRHWRTMVHNVLKWVSQDLTGMFPEDEEDRSLGFQEQFVSPALANDFNLLVAKLATLEPSVKQMYTDERFKANARSVEDAAVWLLDQIGYRHAEMGNRDWGMDMGHLIAAYGMVVSRQVLLPDDHEFPLDVTLIDPAQVYPVWGGRKGLRAVYRVYRDTIANIVAAYGDFAPTAMKALEKKYGADITDESELNVVEYWDTWWRCVLIDDVPVLPVVAHEYGYVPYTVQYAGMGEPLFTKLPTDTGATKMGNDWVVSTVTRDDERVRKAIPAIYYHIRSHETREAVMARLLTGFKKEINPPVIRYRSNMASEKPMPTLESGPGMQNEAMLGEERIEPFPSQNNGFVTQAILGNLLQDWQTTSMPMAAFGQVDRSNVTGAALSQLSDAGMDKLVPHVKGMKLFTERMLSQCLMTIRNFGHLAAYQEMPPRPLMVPAQRPKKGESPAFALDANTIDPVGTNVRIEFRQTDPRDWVGLFNAGALGVQNGFITREQVVKMAHGEANYGRFFEEWQEEDALFKTLSHPKYNELFNIPMMIMSQMREVESNPVMFTFYRQMLEAWLQIVSEPSATELQGMQTQMKMQLNDLKGGTPPQTAGTDLTSLGQGPGSQGGSVGRPSGGSGQG
jgi:hypothetical protein